MSSVREIYEQTLKLHGYQPDPAQLLAVDALQRCASEWVAYESARESRLKWLFSRPALPRGVYMYGGVGRGKSFLMDCFFRAVPLEKKTRLHFHEFMREVSHQLHELQGTTNPLDVLGKKISERFQLICFDEFHIADITDAMILYRLLESLFANGVGFVTTSNFRPDELYPDGLHRDRLLPAIALLNERLEVIQVDYGVDYRRQMLERMQLYYSPLDGAAESALEQVFDRLADGQQTNDPLQIESREIPVRKRAGSVAWFDFRILCGGPRSQNDYLELATRFQTIILSGVPKMPVSMASAARRFTWLVDVLYDRAVKLIMSADVAPDELYTEGPLLREFPRTVSRLMEMQTPEYLAQEHRLVATELA